MDVRGGYDGQRITRRWSGPRPQNDYFDQTVVGTATASERQYGMRLQSLEDFAAAIRAVEEKLGARYPSSAAALFAELASILSTGHPHGLFKDAHLLTTATAVASIRNELGGPLYDGYLLPFLSDGQGKFPDVYGFDLGDPARARIGVYSVHTIVNDWPSPEAFVAWARAFVPRGRPIPEGGT